MVFSKDFLFFINFKHLILISLFSIFLFINKITYSNKLTSLSSTFSLTFAFFSASAISLSLFWNSSCSSVVSFSSFWSLLMRSPRCFDSSFACRLHASAANCCHSALRANAQLLRRLSRLSASFFSFSFSSSCFISFSFNFICGFCIVSLLPPENPASARLWLAGPCGVGILQARMPSGRGILQVRMASATGRSASVSPNMDAIFPDHYLLFFY